MPRHHSFWVILSGTTYTSFRASTRDALLPTFRQLQRTQPDVSLRWFENGRVWESPEAARAAVVAARFAKKPATRGPQWRPGGAHVDPRAKYEMTRDQKRARFKRLQRRPAGATPESGGPAGSAGGPDRKPAHGGRDRWTPAGGDRPQRPRDRDWTKPKAGGENRGPRGPRENWGDRQARDSGGERRPPAPGRDRPKSSGFKSPRPPGPGRWPSSRDPRKRNSK